MKSILFKILGLVAPATGLTQDASLITAFTNPVPIIKDFGWSVAAMGSDRVLLGAVNYLPGSTTAGAAYLFNTNGALITTFTNPAPAQSDGFGISIATLGTDRVLIGAGADDTGAADAGAAYLFNINGTLLTSFSNPSPAVSDFFGHAVTAVGDDRVLIGAFSDFGGSPPIGAAYLFDTNGTLLTTFTNPAPTASDSGSFGISVAALGGDRVIIGAGYDLSATVSGAAYLFSTNGTLLTTFTNPTPAIGDEFGFSVAAVGADRVLVGARFDDTSTVDAGAAYLFSTNGTLLTSFINPTPTRAFFGTSVAAMGKGRVLIGAPAGTTEVAYLFDVNGTLLTSITNPAENAGDFGNSVAVMGDDLVLIGAPYNHSAGAYLLRIPPVNAPSLSIELTTSNSVVVSWPSSFPGFLLQQNANRITNVNWSNVTANIQDVGTNRVLIDTPSGGERYYRLFKP